MCGAVGGYSIALSTAASSPSPAQPVEYGTADDFKSAIKELKETIKHTGGVLTDRADLIIHGESSYHHHNGPNHGVIVYPQNTEDVVNRANREQIQNACRGEFSVHRSRLPVSSHMRFQPYSGATSLEGQIGGHHGGSICVDMSTMDAILEIHEADADLVCQPGVGWMTINETLRSKGIPLFFPVQEDCVFSLNVNYRRIANAVRYGTARGEWFLNMTVVLPSGEVIKTRRRSRKSAAGFDLTKLFIGAEGTLGIITEVTIRLAPVLPTTVATVQFPNVGAAAEAVLQSIDVAGVGASVQCVELVDDNFMTALNKFGSSKRKYLEKDGLFFKFQGHSEAAMKDVAKVVKAVCEKNGGTGFKLANGRDEADAMWSDRKNALNIGLSILPGAKGWSTRMSGTGEHGVGVSKKKYLAEELGPGTVELMKKIKQTIDPLGLFNPGKVTPVFLYLSCSGAHTGPASVYFLALADYLRSQPRNPSKTLMTLAAFKFDGWVLIREISFVAPSSNSVLSTAVIRHRTVVGIRPYNSSRAKKAYEMVGKYTLLTAFCKRGRRHTQL
ncbi:hypothetical protein B0H11DRAFT_1917811 [Mycena galericulata]|nr:hypothetical protein B0H11DRAFT_1917811 [Mycena galericulata]